jgi:tetratricopeptide (TPR) repeat protein
MTCRSLLPAVLILSISCLAQLTPPPPVRAQEALPEGISLPNYEESSYSTLMERTDMGNVAQSAKMQYSSGLRDLKKARRLQEKAAGTADPQEREKTAQKAHSALESADKAFREALSFDAGLVEAYAGLGTALRLQGNSQDALQVHAMALRRDPTDTENFRGWTDSLLALNLLGNATTAYTDYAQTNPKRAEILMDAIEEWLEDKETEPGDIDPSDVQRLAAWVAQQKKS